MIKTKSFEDLLAISNELKRSFNILDFSKLPENVTPYKDSLGATFEFYSKKDSTCYLLVVDKSAVKPYYQVIGIRGGLSYLKSFSSKYNIYSINYSTFSLSRAQRVFSAFMSVGYKLNKYDLKSVLNQRHS